jgi:colanic acid biosynthesis glycosyl transferase WcaI
VVKRILTLSPYFWPEEIGSAPYCTDLALWLQGRGHDVRVVAFRPHYPSAAPFREWASGARDADSFRGVPITRVPVTDRGNSGMRDRLKNDLTFLWHVLKGALSGDFAKTDVTIAYVPSILTLYGAWAVRLATGARIVAVVHDIESGLARALGLATNRFVSGLMCRVECVALNRADRVIVLTAGMRDEIAAIGCVRPISVLSIWAAPSPPDEISPAAKTIILYSGNFGKKQNLDQLLPLIERLSLTRPDIGVVLRGDGSEKLRLEKLVRDKALANTTFQPLAPVEDFIAVLQAANIHLVPQAQNVANYALPSKVFSIMAAGRPFVCVAEKGSALDELAKSSGAGLCVSPGDQEALYTAVAALAGDIGKQREMGNNGRTFVERQMNRDAILSAYEECLQSL